MRISANLPLAACCAAHIARSNMPYKCLNSVLRQGAAECADLCSMCIKLRYLANVIINAGSVMIQSAIVGVGRFAEGVRASWTLPYAWSARRRRLQNVQSKLTRVSHLALHTLIAPRINNR